MPESMLPEYLTVDPKALAQLQELPATMLGEVYGPDVRAIRKTALSARHVAAVDYLEAKLTAPRLDRPGRGSPAGWTFQRNPRVPLGMDIICPDIAGWAPGRKPADGAPDWVVEAFGVGDWRQPGSRRMRLMLWGGVRAHWSVLFGQYRCFGEMVAMPGGSVFTDKHEHGLVRAAPFNEVELDLEHLWSADR